MKKTLFKVHIDTYVIVQVPEHSSSYDIRWAARQSVKSHLDDVEDTDITFEKLKSVEDLPKPWTSDCLPYSGESYPDDYTIGEMLGEE